MVKGVKTSPITSGVHTKKGVENHILSTTSKMPIVTGVQQTPYLTNILIHRPGVMITRYSTLAQP